MEVTVSDNLSGVHTIQAWFEDPTRNGVTLAIGSGADPGFDELRELCDAAGDKRSLAIGMTGLIAQQFTAHHPEATDLAAEQIRLFDAIDDPTLTVGFAVGALAAKLQANAVPVSAKPDEA